LQGAGSWDYGDGKSRKKEDKNTGEGKEGTRKKKKSLIHGGDVDADIQSTHKYRSQGLGIPPSLTLGDSKEPGE